MILFFTSIIWNRHHYQDWRFVEDSSPWPSKNWCTWESMKVDLAAMSKQQWCNKSIWCRCGWPTDFQQIPPIFSVSPGLRGHGTPGDGAGFVGSFQVALGSVDPQPGRGITFFLFQTLEKTFRTLKPLGCLMMFMTLFGQQFFVFFWATYFVWFWILWPLVFWDLKSSHSKGLCVLPVSHLGLASGGIGWKGSKSTAPRWKKRFPEKKQVICKGKPGPFTVSKDF